MEKQKVIYHHSTPVQIRFNDIDLMGHVNNAVIQEYFDLGRMHYLNDVFDERIITGHNTLFIASINTNFMAPVFIKGNIEVKTAVVHIGNKSLVMKQELVNTDNQSVAAECESVMVAVNKQNSESVLIPEEWRLLTARHEKREF